LELNGSRAGWAPVGSFPFEIGTMREYMEFTPDVKREDGGIVREWHRAGLGQGLSGRPRRGMEEGNWVIDVPELATAQGNSGLGALCTLRRKHEWGATEGEDGIVWAARDTPATCGPCFAPWIPQGRNHRCGQWFFRCFLTGTRR
jgi:hypothetical protein